MSKLRPVIHFWSSTEYGGFLQGLVRALNEGGDYRVSQRFLISEESYRRRRTAAGRIWLRFQQYIGYPLYLCWSLLKPGKADIVVVSSNTFYAPLLASFLHPQVIHLVYDLFPEALVMSGKIGSQSLLAGLIRRTTAATATRVKMNVLLGRRLEGYVCSTHEAAAPTCVIPVGADANLFGEPISQGDRVVKVLYCGNFGNLHDLVTFKGAMSKLSDEKTHPREVHWFFHCSGPKYGQLKEMSDRLDEHTNCTVYAGLPQQEWVRTMSDSHIALVTMVPGAEKVVMPSKTYSAMCAGQAILAIAPEESDLVDLIKEHDCGWWVEPGDVEGLVELVRKLPDMGDEVLRKRSNAHAAGHKFYSQEALAKQWMELFESLMQGPANDS